MGLINKAIEKAETRENPPVEKVEPPKSSHKKKRWLGAAVLLVTLSLSGLGYFRLIKSVPEPPPKVARRSISARIKSSTQKSEQAEQKKEAVTTSETTEQTKTAAPDILARSNASQQRLQKAGLLSGEEPGESISEAISSSPDTRSQTADTEQESEIQEAVVEESLQVAVISAPAEEEKTHGPASPSGGHQDKFEESRQQQTFSPEETLPEEEVMPSYARDLSKWLAEKPLTVKERSFSRAQRYFDKGTAYQQQGKYEKAIESFKKALNFDPGHLQAHINLATACLQTGRFKEAEQKLLYLYALRPNDCTVLYNFGLLLYKTGELFSAENKLKRLVELDPLHLEAHLLLGSVYEEKREINQALNLYIKAYRINSADPGVLYRLGRAWDIKGDLAEAVKYYRFFLNTASEKDRSLSLAVRDRLGYLVSRKEVGGE